MNVVDPDFGFDAAADDIMNEDECYQSTKVDLDTKYMNIMLRIERSGI
jgi:hypothetical protein